MSALHELDEARWLASRLGWSVELGILAYYGVNHTNPASLSTMAVIWATTCAQRATAGR